MNPYRTAIFAIAALTLSGCGSHSSSSNNASAANAWSIKTSVNQMTNQKMVYAVDTAKSSIANTYGMKYSPELILACGGAAKKEVGLFISLGNVAVISGDIARNVHPVNIRFDNNTELKWNVSASNNGKGYFFNDPVKLLGKASNAKRMLFQFTTMLNSQQEVVNFDISGTNDVLKKMQCHL